MTELKSYSINNLNIAEKETANNFVDKSVKLNAPVHYPRLDSKIILQNMEEVLDSVKKQHKEKHRRKKELKKLAMTEAATGTEVVSSSQAITKDKKKELTEKKRRHKEKRHIKKVPLQEKSDVENGKLVHDSPLKTGTILQHFSPTPKKDDNRLNQGNEVKANLIDESENDKEDLDPPNNSKVTNAFEVMMNARNKCIGSNTPGKDSPSPVVDKELATENAKRKLKLQEWAEQMGGSKRKLDEEARAAYVEEKLQQRAKRFKKMLVSGGAASSNNSPRTAKTETQIENHKNKSQENFQKAKSKRRRAPRRRRISSVESVDSVELLTPLKFNAETTEFLSKLNSPTKKRDSLLGYFQKKETPKELTAKRSSRETKKQKEIIKMGKPKTINKKVSSIQRTSPISCGQLPEKTQIESCTPSGRPRRSCAGKTRYDYDLDESPSKGETKNAITHKTATRRSTTHNFKANQEVENIDTIILDDSTNMSAGETTTPLGTPKKLAPLFVKSLPKPSPDPEILKARKAFLQSGVPEKLRLEQEKQKQFEQNFEESAEIFPKISHIKQLSEFELLADKEIIKCSINLKSEHNLLLSPSPTKRSKSRSAQRSPVIGSLSDCLAKDIKLPTNRSLEFSLDKLSLPSLANKREIIKNWKIEFDRFPTYKCYNQMREKYRYFSAIDSAQDTEQVSESFVVTRQTRRSLEAQKKKDLDNPDEEYKPPPTAPNGELLFSEKYKPLLFEQVLVNLSPVTQLKEFLANWSIGGTGSAKNSQTLDDSMDMNDSSCSNQAPSSNTIVLLGPVSSGKTYAVFALANEMNFNVLEINAGMKRTGKRLIQELQEATQSHQIRKDAAGAGSSQKNLLKMSLNGLKSKHNRQNSSTAQMESQNSDSNSSEQQNSARKCLILIEDADIVFDQTDAGFTEAIYSLAASSKRPVIVVATDSKCAHLQRLISQNSIHFSSPNVLNISKFLAVLSLIENCPIQLDDLISLYLYNNRDLRKTLLELQFFIQSGGDRHRQLQQNKSNCSRSTEEEVEVSGNYFASPRKRQFSVEQQEAESTDNNIPNEKNNSNVKTSDQVYMHRSLFEFFTVSQNSKCRIPFPIDFHLLNINLNDIFQVSRKLKDDFNTIDCADKEEKTKHNDVKKRKTKTPKKQWLTTSNANLKTVTTTTAAAATPLDNLCSFYEDLSTAALMDEQDGLLHWQNKQKKLAIIDRLQPNISETIAHCLLEKSIEVNLAADCSPYNLFDTPKNRISLSEELGPMQLCSNRARYLDYEPSLRSICRSEQMRSTLERKSTRFYHYLRNYTINLSNFSTTHFDQACEAFQATSPAPAEDSTSKPT